MFQTTTPETTTPTYLGLTFDQRMAWKQDLNKCTVTARLCRMKNCLENSEEKTTPGVPSELLQYHVKFLHGQERVEQRHEPRDRLPGLVVKVSASGAEDPGFESRL